MIRYTYCSGGISCCSKHFAETRDQISRVFFVSYPKFSQDMASNRMAVILLSNTRIFDMICVIASASPS